MPKAHSISLLTLKVAPRVAAAGVVVDVVAAVVRRLPFHEIYLDCNREHFQGFN